jgi:alpha-glucosidase
MQWWQSAILYQIYPRSFQDANGDGIGDLPGIIERLQHLVELGVDALWLSPIFASPMADFGYDISDYTAIDPVFGTLRDFDALLAAAHAHGLKVLLDFVPNHTSDRHPWFMESRASRDNPKRDWYIWRDAAPDGGPPNNWLSEFGGSAWAFDEASGQYYYHAFLSAQPDLNWRNAEVRVAMHGAMRFWLRRGVDGFRVDVIWHLIKDDLLRDNPLNPDFRDGQMPYRRLTPLYSADRPEVHDVISGLRAVADEFSERVLIGEVYLPVERLAAYYGRDLMGAHLPFNFSLLETPWQGRALAQAIERYEAVLPPGGWPNWVLGNHDRPRLASRLGAEQTRVAAMLLLTLRGTPTLYYGDEIGMRQFAIKPEQVRDPWEKNVPGFGAGRDGCRTPMPWDDTVNAGFTAGAPWLPVADDFATCNVAAERVDPASLYNLYRRLTALRRSKVALVRGSYRTVMASDEVLAYMRQVEGERLLILLNFGSRPASVTLPAAGTVLVSTDPARDGGQAAGSIALSAHEGAVVGLNPA